MTKKNSIAPQKEEKGTDLFFSFKKEKNKSVPFFPFFPLQIFVFFGMIATGKSTLAQLWAQEYRLPYYNSDVLRKEFAGSVAARSAGKKAFGEGIYAATFSKKTYALLLQKAEDRLNEACSVILDASYSTLASRQEVITLAERYGIVVHFIYCFCPETEMRRRMESRAKDPLAISDGRWEIYLRQKEVYESLDHLGSRLITMDTSSSPEQLLKNLKTRIVAR